MHQCSLSSPSKTRDEEENAISHPRDLKNFQQECYHCDTFFILGKEYQKTSVRARKPPETSTYHPGGESGSELILESHRGILREG